MSVVMIYVYLFIPCVHLFRKHRNHNGINQIFLKLVVYKYTFKGTFQYFYHFGMSMHTIASQYSIAEQYVTFKNQHLF